MLQKYEIFVTDRKGDQGCIEENGPSLFNFTVRLGMVEIIVLYRLFNLCYLVASV